MMKYFICALSAAVAGKSVGNVMQACLCENYVISIVDSNSDILVAQ